MNIPVNFYDPNGITAEDSLNLVELSTIFTRSYNFSVQPIFEDNDVSHKKAEVTIALSIVGVVISGISAVISAVAVWQARHPKYSVTIQSGDLVIAVDNVGRKELPATVAEVKQAISDTTPPFEPKILIAKR